METSPNKDKNQRNAFPSSGWSEETTLVLSVGGAIGDVSAHGRNKIHVDRSRGMNQKKLVVMATNDVTSWYQSYSEEYLLIIVFCSLVDSILFAFLKNVSQNLD